MRASDDPPAPMSEPERPLSLRVRLHDNDPLTEILLAKAGRMRRKTLLMALAILANFRFHPRAAVFYSRDRTHYSNTVVKFYFPPYYTYAATMAAVDALVRAGLVEENRSRPSSHARRRSTLHATSLLLSWIAESRVWAPQSVRTELVELRSSGKSKQLLTYEETAEIRAMRAELEAFNASQATFDVSLDESAGATEAVKVLLGLSGRQYHRVFSEDLDHGGRFYAQWQNIDRRLRAHITINGRPTFEHDFKCCHPRLLDAIAGTDYPFHDPQFDFYQLAGFARAEVKAAFNILLNVKSFRSAQGALAAELHKAGRADAPARASQLRRAAMAAWPEFAPFWCKGTGMRLQRIDAEVCSEVLAEMRARRIPVLSIHDSFIVPAEHKADLVEVMERCMQRACHRLREASSLGPKGRA